MLLVTIPVAPVITGTIIHFRFHIRCNSMPKFLYFNFFSASFCTAFLSEGIATSISVHVFSFLFLIIICDLLLSFLFHYRRIVQPPVTLGLTVNQPYLTHGKFMTHCPNTRGEHAILTSSPGSASLLHLLSLILSIGHITSHNFNTESEPSPLDFVSKITATMTLHIFPVVFRQQRNHHGKALN